MLAISRQPLLFILVLLTGSVWAAVKPQYRSRPNCGSVSDQQIRSNQPFPWIIKILDPQSNLVSAGSLILDNLVLTSAQFISSYDVTKLAVETASGQQMAIDKISIHPDFAKNPRSDLALIYLKNRLRLGDDVETMCIFSSFVPKNCIGYSMVKLADGRIHVEKFDLPILPSDQCLNNLRESNLWDSRPFPANNLCAMADKNRCRGSEGDRGTGIFCPVPDKSGQPAGSSGRYVQIGVSSWGPGCNNQPGMYTNIPFYSSWLQKAVLEQLA